MEKADKVYLVFGRHAVESEIDQLIRMKRTSMGGMHDKIALKSWRISVLFCHQIVKKNDIRMERRRKYSRRFLQKKVSRNEEKDKNHTLHVRKK